MTAGGGGSAVAGGPALHIPVLGAPALDFLNVHDGGVYIDGTFGAGGYSRAILARRGTHGHRHRPRPDGDCARRRSRRSRPAAG